MSYLLAKQSRIRRKKIEYFVIQDENFSKIFYWWLHGTSHIYRIKQNINRRIESMVFLDVLFSDFCRIINQQKKNQLMMSMIVSFCLKKIAAFSTKIWKWPIECVVFLHNNKGFNKVPKKMSEVIEYKEGIYMDKYIKRT